MHLVLLIGGYSESSIFFVIYLSTILVSGRLALCFIVSLLCSLVLHKGFADKAAQMLRCSTVEAIIINCTVQVKKRPKFKGRSEVT